MSLPRKPEGKMYNGYTESAAKIAARKARILKAKPTKHPRKKLCICLEYIGDNGDCPVHGKGLKKIQ
jgi:hypothetical protein